VRVAVVDPSCSGSGMGAHSQGAAAAPLPTPVLAAGTGAGAAAAVEATTAASALYLIPPASDAARVTSLAGFQRCVLLHVLRSLPGLARAVYSTCSIWAAEDEGVVAAVMRDWEEAEAAAAAAAAASAAECTGSSAPLAPPRLRTRLVLLPSMPAWERRGIEGTDARVDSSDGAPVPPVLTPTEAAACLRAFPGADATGGFFVAVLHKAAVLWTPPAPPLAAL
jgi:16S rRNA C967 or C1407 C5-methylase (RsmB/RsmF family)